MKLFDKLMRVGDVRFAMEELSSSTYHIITTLRFTKTCLIAPSTIAQLVFCLFYRERSTSPAVFHRRRLNEVLS